MKVTIEKVLAGLLPVVSGQLSFSHPIRAHLKRKCACLRGGTLPGRTPTDDGLLTTDDAVYSLPDR